MIRLVYVSTASTAINDAVLSQIVSAAAQNNAAHDISGLLVYNGINFLQVLEGREESILALMEKIQRDHRHFGIVTLMNEKTSARAFPSRSMRLAHSKGANQARNLKTNANGLVDDALPRTVPDNVAAILRNFNSLI